MSKITEVFDRIDREPVYDEVPEGISAHDLLRLVYQGKVKLTSQQLRAAEAALPYESPKLSAVGFIRDAETFATRLERAISRSDRAKLIEAKVVQVEDQ
jgi:EAL domain-containing protein (putative c-di-GMP-specific phosphodiesterase class I)